MRSPARTSIPRIAAILFATGLLTVAGEAAATPYVPGSGWQEFTATTSGSGPHFNIEGPFTFDVVAAQNPVLHVDWMGLPVVHWEGFDFGVYNRIWCPAPTNSDLVCQVPLDEGPHSLTFKLQQWHSPVPSYTGRFQVLVAPIPEPNTALLLSLGLTGLAARRRSLRS